MKQQIISVSQLTKQTNYVVLFLPHSFYVKDLQTGQTTNKGSCIDGLYRWPTLELSKRARPYGRA